MWERDVEKYEDYSSKNIFFICVKFLKNVFNDFYKNKLK